MANILDITRVDIYRGLKKVFADLTLSIPAGQNTAIIGPNGAGKSTLLRTISRDVYPHLGEGGALKIFGESSWSVWELRQRLGIVSLDLQQNFNPFTEGAGVVRTGFHGGLANFTHQTFTDDQLAIADRLMEELGVSELRDKNYLNMSTGEQRRFLLARALVTDPEALILDEPTTGLDLPSKFQYMQTIHRLMKEGRRDHSIDRVCGVAEIGHHYGGRSQTRRPDQRESDSVVRRPCSGSGRKRMVPCPASGTLMRHCSGDSVSR